MIKHIVMWRVRGDTPEERHAACVSIKDKFEGLRTRVQGLIEIEVGINSSTVDYACDVMLYSVFETQQALQDYAIHPEHRRVQRELGDVRVARFQVDYAYNPA